MVKLQYLNSLRVAGNWTDRSRIRALARELVRNSGWVDKDSVTFGVEDWSVAREQREGNTCGIHAVVNAWAMILGLMLAQTSQPFPRLESFYSEAAELMARATAGNATAMEIQRWLLQRQCASGIAIQEQQFIIAEARTVKNGRRGD